MISGCICWLHLYWLLTCAKTYGMLHERMMHFIGTIIFFLSSIVRSSYIIWYTFMWTLDMWLFSLNSVSIFFRLYLSGEQASSGERNNVYLLKYFENSVYCLFQPIFIFCSVFARVQTFQLCKHNFIWPIEMFRDNFHWMLEIMEFMELLVN